MSRLRRLARNPWLPAGVVIAVALVAFAGIVFASTPVGCKVGLHLARCQSGTANLAGLASSPTPTPIQNVAPPQFQTLPPTAPPAPSPLPTRNPSYPPYQYDVSASYPPEYANASQAWPGDISLSCRLPMYAGPSGSGGFVVFPQGQWIADPHSSVSLPPPPPSYSPPPGLNGIGPGQLSYDKAYSRWLPVQRALISPDGKRYAYNYFGGQGIYVMDVASNTPTEIGQGQVWTVIDVEAEGVYASVVTSLGQPPSGLWLLPFSGAPKQITSSGYWSAVGGGAAYGTSTSAVPAGATNTIQRLDLKTGAVQPWFAVDGAQSSVIGFDLAGNPLIQDSFNFGPQSFGTQIWIVPALAKGYVIANNAPFSYQPVADSHGIWFPGGSQTFLFVPGRGTFVAASIGGIPAGECA